MRRSEQEILEIVYRRSGQIRMRRHILQILAGAMAVLVLSTTAPSFVRQLSIQKLNTADQPETEQANSDEAAGSGGLRDILGPGTGPGGLLDLLGFGAVPPARGTSSNTTIGSSGAQTSETQGSLPGGSTSRGLEIAFNRESDIYLMNTDGTGLRKLTSGEAPGWSPDGKHIAFSDNYWVGSINADGSGLQNLRARGTFPTWSPDGERLTFNWECDEQAGKPCDAPNSLETQRGCGPLCGIGVVGRDGTGVGRLGTGLWPDWGPDGRIIFTDGIPSEPCQYRAHLGVRTGDNFVETPECALPIWVMNPDGSGRTRLPVDQAIMPTWSRDGRKIAYYTDTAGVFTANADGTAIVNFAPAGYMYPSWSPDGLWLALTRRTGFNWSIYVRATTGSHAKQLTSGPSDGVPAFSPQR